MFSQVRYDSSKFFCFGEQAFVKENALYIFCKDYLPPHPCRQSQEKIFLGSSLWEPGVPGGKIGKSVGITLSFQQVATIIT